VADAVRREPRELGPDRFGTAVHHGPGDQADAAPRLAPEHADEIRVAHRRQRVVAHRRIRQQFTADEQVAEVDRALVDRERRAGDREFRAERVEQGFGDRADVAGVGRVERRAVLEVDLPHTLGTQPRECRERLRDRLGGGNRARLQRDDDGVGRAFDAARTGDAMVWTVRMPARTSMLARSVAPVKSSAMQPRSIVRL